MALIWNHNPDSIVNGIYSLLLAAESKATIPADKELIRDLLALLKFKIHDLKHELIRRFTKEMEISETKAEGYFKEDDSDQMFVYRKALMYISLLMRRIQLFQFHPAIADIVLFHSFTSFFFKSRSYSGFDQNVDIRECDLTIFQKYLENSELKIEEEGKIVNRQIKYLFYEPELTREITSGDSSCSG